MWPGWRRYNMKLNCCHKEIKKNKNWYNPLERRYQTTQTEISVTTPEQWAEKAEQPAEEQATEKASLPEKDSKSEVGSTSEEEWYLYDHAFRA